MSNIPAEIQSFLDSLVPTLLAVNEVLDKWNGEGCLQLPALLGSVAVSLNWNDEQVRKNDPIIRQYIRNHAEYIVTRGAHGGIMKRSEKQKKEAEAEVKKLAREEAKKEALVALAAKIAAKQVATPSTETLDVEDNTNIVTE
jgi:hypothetical protein